MPTSSEVVDALIKISHEEFGGKQKGRYRLTIKELETITGKRIIYEDYLERISIAAAQMGYVFARLTSDSWLFMKSSIAYRKVPKTIAIKYRCRDYDVVTRVVER